MAIQARRASLLASPAAVRSMRAAGLGAVLALLGGCDDGETADGVAVDSTLVNVMVDLHLADARGEMADTTGVGDSLRAVVYDAHGLDSTRLRIRLDDLAREPGAADAFAEAVEERLSTERHGASPP